MKRYVLFLIFNVFLGNLCQAQEWLTSLDAAKRIALVQDKFLFMIWEDAAEISYPVTMQNDLGLTVVFDNLFGNDEIDQIIWEYFVPVKISESEYATLYDQVKIGKSKSYLAQFEDDNIKIMDTNGMILNTSLSPEAYFDLSRFIAKYALNTSFLEGELKNYGEQQSFNTAFRLASKYMDYAILVTPNVRTEVLDMAIRYLDESEIYLLEEGSPNLGAFQKKIELLRLSKFLIMDRPGKVLRKLKRIDPAEIEATNQSQYDFLYYAAYLLKKDKKNADLWKDKISLVNLKKAALIASLFR